MLADALLQDLRYGLRMLFHNAGFTLVTVGALALGIGVNTAAFTAYKALVDRPVDARDAARMVNFTMMFQSGASAFLFSYPDYEAYRDRVRTCSGVIAWMNDSPTLTGAGGMFTQRSAAAGSLFGRLGLLPAGSGNAEFATTFIISENYFSVLGAAPLRGRSFESIPAAELAASPAVLISENYWQKRFAGEAGVLGRTIRLNGAAFTIAGITPHDFTGTSVSVPDFWLPLPLEPLLHPDSSALRGRDDARLRLFGRLAPGVDRNRAQAEVTLVASQLRGLHARSSEWSRPATALLTRGSPLPGKLPAALRLTILLIMLAAGLVLVIACANVASLQLARATTRQGELAMRLSLGAARARIIRQLLTESALVAVLAGLIALPFTWAILRTAATMFRQAFPIEVGTVILNVAPDLEVFAYVAAVSVGAGLLFGLAPALESSRSSLFAAVSGVRGTSPVRSRRLRDVLIASQVAVSLVLMIAGGMLIRSSLYALNLPTGYDGKHVVDLSLRFPEGPKYNADRRLALVRELRSRVAALPGVVEITSARAPDDNGLRSADISLNGEAPSPGNRQAVLFYTWVQANYLRTMQIPLLAGRGFREQSGQPERSALVSESAARALWPGQNPVGRRLRLGTVSQFRGKEEPAPDGGTWQVIGMTADSRGFLPDGSDSRQIYLPLPDDRLSSYPILLRMRSDPAVVVRRIDSVVLSVDPDMVASTATLEEMLRQTPSFLGAAFAAAAAITIGLFGVVLAAMGIYGTVSYIAVLRTREVGIRMAIGARRSDILALMMRESAKPVVGGLAAGMVLATGAARALRGVLYGLHTIDGVSFLGSSLLFLGVALIATWPPCRRATRVDPTVALRYE